MSVGRLGFEKSIDFLIRSLSREKMENSSLIIVGDGPARVELEKLACDVVGVTNVFFRPNYRPNYEKSYTPSSFLENLIGTKNSGKKSVVFMGEILDEKVVAHFYGNCDLFASASASETFGFTVAEALSCGTPAIVVRAGKKLFFLAYF